jgi:hypothetical protein
VNLSRLLLLLQLATPFALGQTAGADKPARLPNEPKTLVRSLYNEVVARHPLGNPVGEDMKVFAPYLSKALLRRIDDNFACQRDWDRQNPDPNSKPPFLEFGLFSGDDERAEPTAFEIEGVQGEKDASTRVDVKLTRHDADENPWGWNVAAVLVQENGHLVVDDVIWLKESPQEVDVRLSEYLTEGCDGPHWVGFKKPESGQKQQQR